MSTTNPPDMTAKVFIVGDFTVGKTNLLIRYCEATFFGEAHRNFEHKMKTATIQGNKIRLVVWDTVEQERYRTVSPNLYRGSKGIIFCYAVNNRESFERLDYWMDQVNQYGGKDARKILVATKNDLADRIVTADEGRRKAEEWGVEFFETSAKEDLNVTKAIESLARDIKAQYLDRQAGNTANNNGHTGNSNVTLNNKKPEKSCWQRLWEGFLNLFKFGERS